MCCVGSKAFFVMIGLLDLASCVSCTAALETCLTLQRSHVESLSYLDGSEWNEDVVCVVLHRDGRA
jgi:hypothetical protein